jgi:hypothetical protein
MSRILHRGRAKGVHPRLMDLLEAWETHGSHIIVVAPNGGLRTDAALQAKFAATGQSGASTLDRTPHGRGAALDIWPLQFLEHVPASSGGVATKWTTWQALPAFVKLQFQAFGEFAEKRGFKWGGRWNGPRFPNGDQPHVEIPDWQHLPFPLPEVEPVVTT